MRPTSMWRQGSRVAPVLLAPFMAACALTEVTLVTPDDVVVAEGQVVIQLDHDDNIESMSAMALLHRTAEVDGSRAVPGASVTVHGASGVTVSLIEQDSVSSCVEKRADQVFRLDGTIEEIVIPFDGATCYRAIRSPPPFAPGEKLEMRVTTADGRTMQGASRAPGAFSLAGAGHANGVCRMDPDTHTRISWSQATGSWAYAADSRIEGLSRALAGRDINVPDSLYLLGLSIGRDTVIDFPKDFGVFDFLDGTDDERKIIRRLAEGMPQGSRAMIVLAAVDRNWVNWARVSFNPSGDVRVPSVFGQGSGVFGTAVQRIINVMAAPATESSGVPPCDSPAA